MNSFKSWWKKPQFLSDKSRTFQKNPCWTVKRPWVSQRFKPKVILNCIHSKGGKCLFPWNVSFINQKNKKETNLKRSYSLWRYLFLRLFINRPQAIFFIQFFIVKERNSCKIKFCQKLKSALKLKLLWEFWILKEPKDLLFLCWKLKDSGFQIKIVLFWGMRVEKVSKSNSQKQNQFKSINNDKARNKVPESVFKASLSIIRRVIFYYVKVSFSSFI